MSGRKPWEELNEKGKADTSSFDDLCGSFGNRISEAFC